jgi:hypothetical protein
MPEPGLETEAQVCASLAITWPRGSLLPNEFEERMFPRPIEFTKQVQRSALGGVKQMIRCYSQCVKNGNRIV